MHNIFYSRPDQRVLAWRVFREELAGSETPLEAVAKWAASAPLSSHNIDCWDSINWPTPWELVDEGIYCEFNVALLIAYTIQLTFPEKYKIDIVLIEDKTRETLKLAVRVNDMFLLNYFSGEVENVENIICSDTIIHAIFNEVDGRYEEAI